MATTATTTTKTSTTDDTSTANNNNNNTKELEIQLALDQMNVWKLRELALTHGGLLHDSFRRQAWPLLLEINDATTNSSSLRTNNNNNDDDDNNNTTAPLEQDVNYPIWERDVSRCTWHISNEDGNGVELKSRQRQVIELIQQALNHHAANTTTTTTDDALHYYQGYADVASIVWNIFGASRTNNQLSQSENDDDTNDDDDDDTNNSMATATAATVSSAAASSVLLQVSQRHFSTVMSSTFLPLQTTLNLIWYPLLDYQNPTLHDLLTFLSGDDDDYNEQQQQQQQPTFCFSWIITWFSHDIKDTVVAKRLFDACLASHPLFIIYASIALLQYHAPTLLALVEENYHSQEEEQLDVLLYPTLSKLPQQTTNDTNNAWEKVIDIALDLMERVPPHQLSALSKHYYSTTGSKFSTKPTWNVKSIPWLQQQPSQDCLKVHSITTTTRARIAMGRQLHNNKNNKNQHRVAQQMTLVYSLCMVYILATEVLLVPTVVVWGMILNQNHTMETTATTATAL